MKQSVKIILGLIAAGLFIGLLSMQLRTSLKEREAEAKAAQIPVVPTVDVLEVTPQALPSAFEAQGVTEPAQQVDVSSEAYGKVTQVYFREGDQVAAGATLARLDAAQKEIELSSARVQHAKARSDYEKLVALALRQNATTNEVEGAKLLLQQLEHNIKALQQSINESIVYAPFAGVIVKKHIAPGLYLQPGSPVASLVDVRSLKAVFYADETEVAEITLRQPVPLAIDAAPALALTGTIAFISASADESGKFPVHVAFTNTYGLKGGMSVRGTFNADKQRSVLLIPKSALVLNSTTPAVFVVGNNQATLRAVVLGGSRENLVEVKEGLEPHTLIVVRGAENVIEGATLTIHEKIASNF